MKKFILTALISVFCMSFSATTTWKGYREILSDYTVNASDILIIEPGALIKFASAAKLIVNGEIRSNGTVDNPVIFTFLYSGEPQWGGIIISSSLSNNEFIYTNFSFMYPDYLSNNAGITTTESNLNISFCRFTDCYGESGGALKINGGNVTVGNSYFYYNSANQGGAVSVLNNSLSPSSLTIDKCVFEQNTSTSDGGAIYIMDNYNSGNLTMNITGSDFMYNNGSNGGAIFYQNESKITGKISKCRFFGNTSGWGSAIYSTFMTSTPDNIPFQEFSNLLVYKNTSYIQSSVHIDMGLTQNPINLRFTNATIAYNIIMMAKSKQGNTSGIYIRSTGNFPAIENSTLWNNFDQTMAPSNYFIDDISSPLPDEIFSYCDIQDFSVSGTNFSLSPLFINPPVISESFNYDLEKYDLHESVFSPCVDSGHPYLYDPDGTRLNIGAYGGTPEAAKTYFYLTDDYTVPDNRAAILVADKGNFYMDTLALGVNSQLFIKAAESTDFYIRSLKTPTGKFDGFCSIEPLREREQSSLPAHNFNVSENLTLHNTRLYNITVKAQKLVNPSAVSINNLNLYADTLSTGTYGLEIVDQDYADIENSNFSGSIKGGISIVNSYKNDKSKARSGRITNNTVNFDTDISSKSGTEGRVGINITNTSADVEGNTINGGDAGIMMKSSTGGRLANNTVNFDTDITTKNEILYKTGILITDNSDPGEISGNKIVSHDGQSNSVTGIEINGSKADIMYNTISFENMSPAAMRAGIKIVNASDSVNIYNNTLYNTLQGFFILHGTGYQPVNIINNIYWSDQPTNLTINDTLGVKFFNNCFVDSTNVTGSGNIFVNPEFTLPWHSDYTLNSDSPCINAGMIIDGVHAFSAGKTVYYYGSAPDIGSEELYQELVTPPNVTTSVTGTNFTFSWDPVPGFFYEIYASDTPYGTFSPIGTTTNTYYTVSISSPKKFYYVLVTTDPSKSGSLIQAAATDQNSDKVKTGVQSDEHVKRIIRTRNKR